MTKPVTRKMAVDCLLHMASTGEMITTIFDAGCYFQCIECGEYVLPGQPIEFDHRHAIVHGGPHVYQNLRPIHAECHKKKTKRDVQANAKVKRIAKGGRKRKGPKMKSRPFPKKKRG